MAGFVKNILVFALLVTVMKGIINNESFKMYFKFFSGLVLVLLMASPLVSFLSGGDGWYRLLEEAVFNFELDSVSDELDIADGRFEEIIREECKEDIEVQIKKMAQKRGINVKNIETKFNSGNSSIQLVSVDIEMTAGNSKETGSQPVDTGTGSIKTVDIETINIMSDENCGNTSNAGREDIRKPVKGKNAKRLKEDISSYFLIKEAAVNIWE
ncbi:MAG TPA: hypothetical protein DCZ23_05375 [Lachnospiraceae bacterium]|nr:hypothetical protein [Lachnospiraceae bacterium]